MSKKKFYAAVGVFGIALVFVCLQGNSVGQNSDLIVEEQTVYQVAEKKMEQARQMDEKTSAFLETAAQKSKAGEEARTVAEQFIRVYHSAVSVIQLESVKDLMTDQLYGELGDQNYRTTADRAVQIIDSISFASTADKQTDQHVTLCVIVKGCYISSSGGRSAGEDWYLVSLTKAEKEWKVTGVWKNLVQ